MFIHLRQGYGATGLRFNSLFPTFPLARNSAERYRRVHSVRDIDIRHCAPSVLTWNCCREARTKSLESRECCQNLQRAQHVCPDCGGNDLSTLAWVGYVNRAFETTGTGPDGAPPHLCCDCQRYTTPIPAHEWGHRNDWRGA